MLRAKLIEFHEAVGQPVLYAPRAPPDERVRLRARLIVEECIEFLDACFPGHPCALKALKNEADFVISGHVLVDLPEAADALADIAYVVEGSNIEFGIDSGPVLDEVHRANMAKTHGRVREDGKALKPPGWTPPDIAGVLARQR